MPSLNEIQASNKKKFKRRDYRPWNLEGNDFSESEKVQDQKLGEEEVLPSPTEPNKTDFLERVISVAPKFIKNWDYYDRPINELGDIDSLAEEFKKIGQQQPCIVRPINHHQYKYELIAGERRWRASKLAGLDLKVLIKDLNDYEAAIVQASENSSRKDLSDYAKGMSYAKLIEKGVLTQKDLIEKLKISKQQVSRLLSFSKIPEEICEAIVDFSKVSARTAEQIKQLSNRGDTYIEAVIHFSGSLRDGSLGHSKLASLVERFVDKPIKTSQYNQRVFTNDGRLLFTWRKEKGKYLSIHFPKDITSLIEGQKLNSQQINEELRKYMESILKIM